MSRAREIQINIRLDQREFETLKRNAKKSGMSQTGYLRSLIIGHRPRARPPEVYWQMMDTFYQVGEALFSLANQAQRLGVIDADRYEKEVQRYREAVKRINRETLLPERVD
jgi:hypothetical protein